MVVSKLQLVNAPLSPTLAPSIRAGAYPPLHLVSLSSYVARHLPNCQIDILDGELLTLEDIVSRLDPHAEWVGVSANTLTYDTAIQVAQAARDLGSKVVLGGAHAHFAATAILAKRTTFDAVVVGDGEEALLRLLRGDPLGSIPNLAYRKGGRVSIPREVPVPFERLPPLDYGFVCVDNYFRRYRSLYPEKPFRGAFTLFSAKGCQWREKTGRGCVFCSIQHVGFRMKPPQSVWTEILQLNEEFGADFFWDVSDTFTMQREWVSAFARSRPKGLQAGLHLYGRPSDVDPIMADDLKDIGTYEVFLGLESGSNATLKSAFKGTTRAHNEKAVRLLNERGIRVVASIMLGLPGETYESLRETCDMCNDLVTMADVSEIHCSILLPLPGSAAFADMLRVPNLKQKYWGNDCIDLEKAREDWVNGFCRVPYGEMLDAQAALLDLGPRVGSFGRAYAGNSTSTDLESLQNSRVAVSAYPGRQR